MSSDTTLVLERRPGGLRLYLWGRPSVRHRRRGDLRTSGSPIPPLSRRARARFEGPLNLLVLGGGDGLLVRELLRHEGVASVRVIDYNPEVLAPWRYRARPGTGSSLADNRVVVEVADVPGKARLRREGRLSFHAIFSDLTRSRHPGRLWPVQAEHGSYARRAPGTRGHPRRQRATFSGPDPGGVLVHLHQTLRSAGLAAIPGRSHPQLRRVGIWRLGVLPRLGPSHHSRSRFVRYPFPPGRADSRRVRALVDCFEFPRQQADSRTTIRPASESAGRTLYEYLLDATAIEPGEAGRRPASSGSRRPVPRHLSPATATVPSLKLKKGEVVLSSGTGIDDLLMCVPLSHRIGHPRTGHGVGGPPDAGHPKRFWIYAAIDKGFAPARRRLTRAARGRAEAVPARSRAR